MSVDTSVQLTVRPISDAEQALLDSAWELLNTDNWPEEMKKAAWEYAHVLIVDSFEGLPKSGVMTRTVINAVESRLKDITRNYRDPTGIGINAGRAVRLMVVMAHYQKRMERGRQQFPFERQPWYRQALAITIKDYYRQE